MSVSLAVKYRPKTLQEMVGQDYVVDILEQQCLTGNTRNCYLFKGLSGSGKAQPLTSKVLTPTGYVNMGDIQVGDCILDGKGNPTTVLGVFPQGVRPIYKITFSDRTSIEVSDEHLNSVYINNVKEHRREDFVLTTLELKEKIKTSPYKLRVELPVIDCWKDENIDIDPYLLGGSIKCGRIPQNYLYSSLSTRISLLQGLFDSVGYLNSEYNYILSLSNYVLAEDVAFLVRSLGINCAVDDSLNTFSIYPPEGFRISARKQYELRNNLTYEDAVREVVSVEYVRDDVCQCIYVESEEHTYLTDNITVTHNTTAGRAFAMKLNNNFGTPVEIDAASNNGVDNIREIIKSANERALDSKYKVIIVDECHALSNAAWQAMLKCIEEPPKYTIFIFCTTDAQKIPATILNRVQVFNFTRIPLDKIKSRLKYICDCEGFTNYEEGIDYIAKLANGGMRDAITYLDKCSTFSKEITINNVLTCLGNFSYDAMFNIVNSIIDGEQGKVMGHVQEIIDQGADMKLFADQFLSFLLDILKFILYKDFRNILIPEYYKDSLIYTTSFENCEKYFSYLVDRTLSMKNMLKNDTSPAVTTQVCFSQMTRGC